MYHTKIQCSKNEQRHAVFNRDSTPQYFEILLDNISVWYFHDTYLFIITPKNAIDLFYFFSIQGEFKCHVADVLLSGVE